MRLNDCVIDVEAAIEQVMRTRRSTRAFKPDPVTEDQMRRLLELAATAPSNSNTQPWRVYVVSGDAKARLCSDLVSGFACGDMAPPAHFPQPLPAQLSKRQDEFAARYYRTLGIERADVAARQRQTQKNYVFFGAPVGLTFTIDQRLKPHSWLDLGLFMQNLMIAAQAHGIATCPQVSFAPFHAILARHLPMGEHEITVCGMSLGYADEEAQVNVMEMPRESVDAFAWMTGFEVGAER
jgi:nitroreductase